MQLAQFMSARNLDNKAMAKLVGGVTQWAVHKWKYGQRIPEAPEVVRIEKATDGLVTLSDWAAAEETRRADRASKSAARNKAIA